MTAQTIRKRLGWVIQRGRFFRGPYALLGPLNCADVFSSEDLARRSPLLKAGDIVVPVTRVDSRTITVEIGEPES